MFVETRNQYVKIIKNVMGKLDNFHGLVKMCTVDENRRGKIARI